MTKAYLLMGSNLGDRYKLLKEAVDVLGQTEKVEVARTSFFYETEPWGVKNQNMFLNLAVEIETSLSPKELLLKCQNTERHFGRNRDKEMRWGERTLDIDIIFYGNNVVETENLVIPHIYMQKRAFVLVPLMDLIPNFVHPFLKKTVSELYNELEEKEKVILYNNFMEELK